MLSLLFLAAIVAALPVAIEGASSQDSEAATSQFAKRIATALEEVGQRSACDLGGDGLPNECHVNSVLRAAFALLCVFLFLVALHVWQAAKYNKIDPVFGAYIADHVKSGENIPYITLEDSDAQD